MVGEGQRLEPEPGRLLGQLLGVRGAVEEAEVGVAVQLGVRRYARPGRISGRVASASGASYGWRLRLHAGPSPPAFHDGEPGVRPFGVRRAVSSSACRLVAASPSAVPGARREPPTPAEGFDPADAHDAQQGFDLAP